jgi:hypothetical protein
LVKNKIMTLINPDLSVNEYYEFLKEDMKNEKEIKKLEKAVEDINKRIDKLKEGEPKIESGKWYIGINDQPIFLTEFKKIEGWVYCYGFDKDGDWFNEYNNSMRNQTATSNIKKPATNEEVEAALIAEAKKRYKKGCIVSSMDTGKSWKIYGKYWMQGNSLANDACTVFKNGVWSEVLKEPNIIINNYEMRQEGDIVSFGCAKFYRLDLTRLLTAVGLVTSKPYNRKIESIKLDSGVEVTVKQLGEIVDNLK